MRNPTTGARHIFAPNIQRKEGLGQNNINTFSNYQGKQKRSKASQKSSAPGHRLGGTLREKSRRFGLRLGDRQASRVQPTQSTWPATAELRVFSSITSLEGPAVGQPNSESVVATPLTSWKQCATHQHNLIKYKHFALETQSDSITSLQIKHARHGSWPISKHGPTSAKKWISERN